MNKLELQKRTKEFGIRIIKMIDSMPNKIASKAIAAQLVRSATSVGANYRAACRARSKAEFHSKLRIVIEEADECCYWLEIIIDSAILPKNRLTGLCKEANELTAIFVATLKTSSAKS